MKYGIHELKCWPGFFEDIATGRKAFEIRKNDRDYHIGDYLFLREWYPDSEAYSGRVVMVRVVIMLIAADLPELIPAGVAVMGIQLLDHQGASGF